MSNINCPSIIDDKDQLLSQNLHVSRYVTVINLHFMPTLTFIHQLWVYKQENAWNKVKKNTVTRFVCETQAETKSNVAIFIL